jgi:uncharacterized protein
MKFLIDIGHPAHVHYWKNLVWKLQERGHKVLFTTMDRDVTIALLENYGFEYISVGRGFKSLPGKIWGLFWFSIRILLISLKFRPDFYLHASPYIGLSALLLRKPFIALEDTYNMEQVRLYLPFTSCVITGDYNHPSLGKRELRLKAYLELLYLYPKYYQPKEEIHELLGINPGERYVILRFVAWKASHDIGQKGISSENKLKIVRELSKYAKIFISSEAELPSELSSYKLKIPPDQMHNALFHADLLFCESFTMASECSILGTPSIVVHSQTWCYLLQDQMKKYGLVNIFSASKDDQEKAIQKAIDILKLDNSKSNYQKASKQLIDEHIDFTGFLMWFIESWPESYNKIKKDPSFQNSFK